MKKLKKVILLISTLIILLLSTVFVSAEGAPLSHTYLASVSDSGEYTFETVIKTDSEIKCKPILAMYDSRNALCGLTIGGTTRVQSGAYKSLTIKVTPEKTPKKIKLMLWNTSGNPVPVSQFESVPDTVCSSDFGSVANIHLSKIESLDYTFEAVLSSPVDATYTPVFRMYDSLGNICGYYTDESISLVAGEHTLKEFKVPATSAPAKIYFTLRNGTEVGQFTCVPTTVAVKKTGVIMDVGSSGDNLNKIKIFADDGTYQYYDFADKFVLSYKNTIIDNKQSACDYLNTLKLKSYKRYADLKINNKPLPDGWTTYYDWLLFFNNTGDNARYSKAVPVSEKVYYLNSDDNIYGYSDYLNNYANRLVQITFSPDGKINSMVFPGDSLFKSVSAGSVLSEAYYNPTAKAFNDSLTVSDNTAILYLPTIEGLDESSFKVLPQSELKKSDYYYLKNFVLSGNKQIILLTYRYSDTVSASELASYNTDIVQNIKTSLYGVNGTEAKPTGGINGKSIALSGGSRDINDQANAALSVALENLVSGLKTALESADEGYLISKKFVKTKCPSEISVARSKINLIEEFDSTYNTDYFNQLENGILELVPESALNFLYDYFITG